MSFKKMPTLTGISAAQVSDGLSEVQSSRTDSCSTQASLPTLPPTLLAPFNINASPSARELYQLQIQLDKQCLQLAAAEEASHVQHETLEVNSLVELAVYLSGSLCLATYPGTFLFQELKSRALISCLALLHYHQVEALNPEQWDLLRRADFQKITFQSTSNSTLEERIRYVPNVYLLQLASQYLSFIRRGDSNLPLVVGPIVKIFWGSLAVAGHQYNHVQQILQGLTQLSTLWNKPQTRYKAIWGLQEYTRLASRLCRDAVDTPNGDAIMEAVVIIASALMEKLEALLDAESRTHSPRLGGQFLKPRGLFNLGSPALDRGYYLFGLLDCAVQLAALIDPEKHRPSLMEKIGFMVLTCDVPEYRWKAIETILSFRITRHQRFDILTSEIEQNARRAIRTVALQETVTIRDLLQSDEAAGLRFYLPASPAIRPHPIDESIASEPESSFGSISSSLRLSCPDSLGTEPHRQPNFPEKDLLRSRRKAYNSFKVPQGKKSALRVMQRQNNYHSAGLSNDCQHCFYYNDNRISIFHLGDVNSHSQASSIRNIREVGDEVLHGEPIFDVVTASRFLVVVTSKRVLTVDLQSRYQIETITLGAWDSAGVACSASQGRLVVALGEGRGNSLRTSKGRIKIYAYELGRSPQIVSLRSVHELPRQDIPKRIFLSEDARILTCVTRIQNRLVVWNLEESLLSPSEPFDFMKNPYRTERYETGISSTSVYTSPSNINYILCTTSPSSERHSNSGEWSFILPLPRTETSATPRIRPPSTTIHNFEQFKAHRPLRTGAVSSKHNVFGVLEDDGRISLLPLVAGAEGGVCGSDDGITFLEERLAPGGALKFTPNGERLIAVGPKGKVVVVEFERIDFEA